MQNLAERVAWAIKMIAADKYLDKGINDIDLAKALGTNKDTLAGYRKGRGLLKGEVIEKIVSRYNFSPQWLFNGLGEPFPGARAKYPDVCGPGSTESPPLMAGGAPSAQRAPHSEDAAEFSIAEDLTLAAKVLESRTHYATALHLNIRSFAGAVDDVMTLRQMNGVLTRLQELESTIASLQAENKALRTDINRLKATYENPGTGAGSLAATAE